jgi:hypothetical protein
MATYTGSISNLTYKPTIIPKPFAYNGSKSEFPDLDTGTNKASFSQGFPHITSQSLADGGVPPARTDFNALGYDTTSWLYYFQNGGVVKYDSNVSNAISGYPQGARLWVDTTSGTIIVKAKQSTATDPATVLTGILNGTDSNWEIDFKSASKSIGFPDYSNPYSFPLDKGIYTAPFDGWWYIYTSSYSSKKTVVSINGQTFETQYDSADGAINGTVNFVIRKGDKVGVVNYYTYRSNRLFPFIH